MENKKPRILIISSADPTKGPGIVAQNAYKIFKENDFKVDLLTKYKTNGHPEYLSVYNCQQNNFLERIRVKVNRLYRKLNIKQTPGYFFFYRKDTTPPIAVSKVLKRITKQYDVVFVYFWQGMLSYKTIEAIYDKLQCLIRFCGVDYSQMAGGCHFTGDCEKYKTGCGACPAIYSDNINDFTAFNVRYRKKVLEKVHPVICGNNYMQTFYKRSYLLKDYDRLEKTYALINHQIFYPRNKSVLRKEYAIPESKKYIFFFAAQNLHDERKGISYLLSAISSFYKRLTDNERNSILLLLAGKDIDAIKEQLWFDYKYLGYISIDELAKVYSLANVFLSPSVNDAGPLTVYQSISCGTPVVSFEMGAAIDAIKDKNTGYCAELRNAEDYAKGMEYIYRLSDEDYASMRKMCQEVSIQLTSEEAFIDRFLNIYNLYREKGI